MIVAPGHDDAVGVIVYVAVPATAPVVDNVCAIVDPLVLLAPETPLCATVQLYVVPLTVLVNTTDGAVPEQIVCVEGFAVATGVGFTIIVPVALTVPQPPVRGMV